LTGLAPAARSPTVTPPPPVTARTHRAKVTVLRQAISAVTVLLAAILLATGDLRLDLPDRVQQGPPSPWEVTSEAWVAAVGGDQQLTEDSYTQLEAVTDPALGPQATAQVRRVAGDLAVATLTGAGQEQFPGYWPPKPATGAKPAPRCSKVTVRAVAPIVLPTAGNAAGVTRYAKALVLYTGTCGQAKYTVASPGSEYLYLAQTEQGWVPVRPWDIPSARGGADVGAAGGEPAPWELAQFGPCAADHQVLRARILVVSAFEQMCADAASEGVTLTLRSAYLTRAEQAARFAQAVAQYGSEAEARKWVAYADEEVCTSRHCTGLAVNLTPTSAAMTWLEKVVGCHDGHSVTPAATCPQGTTPVRRMHQYGFTAPLPTSPGYLEFAMPGEAGAGQATPADCDPAGQPVPAMVAAIFRCRLGQEGVVGPEQDQVVAEALVVSRCESGWNAAAAAFGGRYASQPNPADGRRYTHAGVFMLTAELAEAGWAPADRTDPVANINAAASLWLATRGWEQFGCATGTEGGFEAGPVLPRYGGPDLPDWAWRY